MPAHRHHARAALPRLLVLLLLLAACDGGPVARPETALPTTIDLRSPDLEAGEPIPPRHTCEGADEPPALRWQGVPAEAAELVVLVDDPDAPGGTFTHWLVAGIPPEADEVGAELPTGATQGRNGFADVGWRGPCPPEGDPPHRYVFSVIAVREPLGLQQGFSVSEARALLERHGLARGVLEATFAR